MAASAEPSRQFPRAERGSFDGRADGVEPAAAQTRHRLLVLQNSVTQEKDLEKSYGDEDGLYDVYGEGLGSNFRETAWRKPSEVPVLHTTSTMLVAETLRAEAKARKMKAGTMGLAEGHQPHVRDAAELLQKAWASVTVRDIARCFVKAETLPNEMAAELTKQHGKSQFHVAEPTLKALTETLNTLSTSVHEAHKQGTQIEDEDIAELIAELRIEPGKPLPEEAANAIQGWATIEDDDEVVEAFREDTVEDMTAQLAGTRVSTGRDEEDEEEDSGDDSTGLARRVPPAYGELSSHFSVLEAAAEESGDGDAALHVAKAKMAIIAAHSKRRVRQADMREFVATE